MTLADDLLIRLLARLDAIELPIRPPDWESRLPANREHQRQRGVTVPIGGDAATRKAGERAIVKLIDDGLARQVRRGRERYVSLRFTDRGDERARTLAGVPGADVAWMLTDHLARISPRFPASADGRRWINELFTLPEFVRSPPEVGSTIGEDHRRQLAAVEVEFCCAAHRGWLVCTSSIAGAVAYAVTPAGRAAVAAGPPRPGRRPREVEGGLDLYRREATAMLGELRTSDLAPAGAVDMPAIHCLLYHRPAPEVA